MKISSNQAIFTSKYVGSFVGLFLEGMLDATNGIILPLIKKYHGFNYKFYSLMLTLYNVFGITFSFVTAFVIKKFGYRYSYFFSHICYIIGYLGFYFMEAPALILMSYCILSIGLSFIDLSANSLGSTIFIKYVAILFSVANCVYGVGSLVGPPFIQLLENTQKSWCYKEYSLILLIPIGISFVISLFTPYDKDTGYERKPENAKPSEEEKTVEKTLSSKEIFFSSRAMLLTMILGLFTLCEKSTTAWGYLYATEYLHLDSKIGNNYLTYFFMIFTISRLLNGFITEKIGFFPMLEFIGTMVCILSFIGFSYTSGTTGLYFLASCGYFVSTFWPSVLGVIVEVYKGNAETATGCILPGQGVMILLVNSVLGIINDSFGNQYAYMISMSFCAVALLLTIFLHCMVYLERKEEEKKKENLLLNVE